MTPKKVGIIAGLVILVIVGLVSIGRLIEDVDGGEIHVKQALVSGDLTVHTEEGIYPQMLGRITKYYRTRETYLSKDELDGGKGAETNATLVRFGDGGTADIGSVTQWRLPLTQDAVIKIHRNYRSPGALAAQVRQWIIEVEKQTASTFKAEDTYSTRRGEFSQLVTDQISHGLYATEQVEIDVPTGDYNDEGSPIYVKTLVTRVKSEDGNPVVVKQGIFLEYGLELVNHTLKDIDYDDDIDRLISQKKVAEQEQAVARANAERARQDAITAEETGKARIAQAKADEEVEKITAVTQAKKDKEVAELAGARDLEVARLAKLEAQEEAAGRLIREKAEADANRLKVSAGLTPQQAAEWEFKIADVVSKNLASVDLPSMMIFGGGEGSPMNPWDAVGLESFMNISEQIKGKK